jgi:hypothetical protein
MTMTTIYLDIETLPIVTDEIRAEVTASVAAPTNYGDEAAAKWMATKGKAQIDDALAKGGLDATRGRVLAFSYAIGDDPPVCIMGEESVCLMAAIEVLRYDVQHLYVGHNIAGFDLPFIRQRCWANGIKVPFRPFRVKQWDDCLFDTMLAWSSERDRRISLDRLCRVLGVKSPKQDGMDGSQVWPMYQAGKLDEIRDYALADVVATRECYRRMS